MSGMGTSFEGSIVMPVILGPMFTSRPNLEIHCFSLGDQNVLILLKHRHVKVVGDCLDVEIGLNRTDRLTHCIVKQFQDLWDFLNICARNRGLHIVTSLAIFNPKVVIAFLRF